MQVAQQASAGTAYSGGQEYEAEGSISQGAVHSPVSSHPPECALASANVILSRTRNNLACHGPLFRSCRSVAHCHGRTKANIPLCVGQQRQARSQISTAVSFEPAARPANSAAVASARSGEDSALSAAEAEPEGLSGPWSNLIQIVWPAALYVARQSPMLLLWGESAMHAAQESKFLLPCAGELSSLPQQPQAGAGENDPAEAPERHQLYPSASLLSTAMRPSPPPPQRQPSPQAQRANSVVSKTALGGGAPLRGGGLRAGTPASVYGQGQSLGRHARADSPAVEQVLLHLQCMHE